MCSAWRLRPSRPAATVRPADRVGGGIVIFPRASRGATGLARRRFREARISPLGVLTADGVVQVIQSDFATGARGVNLTP